MHASALPVHVLHNVPVHAKNNNKYYIIIYNIKVIRDFASRTKPTVKTSETYLYENNIIKYNTKYVIPYRIVSSIN